MKDDRGAKPGNVKSLTVTGFHNSFPGCVRSFREAIKPVAGVTGELDAAALVEALNKAGFHVKVRP